MHSLTPAGLIGAAATPVPDAAAQLIAIRTAQSNAKAAIAEAQRRQKAYADRARSCDLCEGRQGTPEAREAPSIRDQRKGYGQSAQAH